MANDLATLRGYLQSALRDTSNATWTTTEMNNAIDRAVRTLSPRITRPLDPEALTQAITTTDYFYSLPSSIIHLSRIDWVDTSSNEMGPLHPGSWEVVGDPATGAAKVHISPRVAEQGGTLRYIGYGRYDTTTNYIPDEYVDLVIAKASVELLHYLLSDRARFLQWANSNQTQNISVTELVTMVNAAEQRMRELDGKRATFRKPVPGRV